MLYDKILKESQRLEKQIKTLQEKLKHFPKGKLICSRNGKYYKWYVSDGKKEKYIPKKQRQFAEKLAFKKYLTYQLEDLIREKKAIDLYLKNHNQKPDKAMTLLQEKPEYQKLVSPYLKPQSLKLQEWMSEPYKRNPAKPENLRHKTSAGFMVRSKSEAMIVEELLRNQLAFRYECEYLVGGVIVYPDFMIIHPETFKMYLWEHFGRMDEREYVYKTIRKLQKYTLNGIIPSIHLITTYETLECPLGIDTIRKTIEEHFFEKIV